MGNETPGEPSKIPIAPYRDDRPLKDVIPPDRRREAALVLIVASMVSGVLWFQFAGDAKKLLREISTPTVHGSPAPAPTTVNRATGTRIGPVTLSGPDGTTIQLPQSTPLVVNVWLQACQDCMPAFEAAAALERAGGLGVHVPVVNVAYGQASPEWAAKYGVAENLVFDPAGASVVQPLGISTFTTLVIDAKGSVRHTDRPDRAGYKERVVNAVRMLTNEHPTPEPAPALVGLSVDPDLRLRPQPSTVPFDRGQAQAALNVSVASCARPEGPSGSGHIVVTFDTDGKVLSAVVDTPPFAGTPIAECIAAKFLRVHVSPFGGGSVRVGKSFELGQRHGAVDRF